MMSKFLTSLTGVNFRLDSDDSEFKSIDKLSITRLICVSKSIIVLASMFLYLRVCHYYYLYIVKY